MKRLNISPQWVEKETNTEVFSVRYSPDGQSIAATLSNGHVLLKSIATGRTSFNIVHSNKGFSVPSIRFNPVLPKTFITISSDGVIKEWNSRSPKNIWTYTEEGNQLYALDIHKAGQIFATAGSDSVVRVYDDKTKQCIHSYARAKYDFTSPSGHSDRAYCVHFVNSDPNLLASGGWDNTIQIWDLRQTNSVMVLPGPHICGDAIDTNKNYLLAGSWRTHDQLQLFDFRTGKCLKQTRWSTMSDDNQAQLYTVKFFQDGSHFVAGGTETNQAKVYNTEQFNSVGSSITFPGGVYSSAISKDNKTVVFGLSCGYVQLHNVI
ncbi:hypothetical protein TVAG_002950 [Trichomonas vaginalis G3]|uniref:Uncharacterized protein n=1 Tax=Trichomonas vaginalis (strain ATCC PRA-98 / G3) TaxID=412133 RepID=A2EZR8_TRIV3|nr:WD repeat-containing protein family [Trichomonas vaginalis G3]EAY01840.1 hypothetical protein TVAG_002950 [Trichomonas vaginalis G3]KAI5497566.1 WD repeat-containing protein family [Trichomonas vaginalis G3]|eukprot:XP_001314387.1 hypothetical protein [Trichomonas vaginalis G3]